MAVSEFIIAIVVAVFSSNGIWVFLSKFLSRNDERHKDIQYLKSSLDNLNTEIQDMNNTLIKTHNLAISTARDRLNYLNYEYMNQGFIPQKDVVPYKLMGESYIENDGNTIVSEEFKMCIDTLQVK